MRRLLPPSPVGDPSRVVSTMSDDELVAAYAVDGPWVRANMLTSLDGRVVGATGRAGDLHTPADQVVFDVLRAWSDVVVVGAGTVRAEGYGLLVVPGRFAHHRRSPGRSTPPCLAVVSTRGSLPPSVLGCAPSPERGSVLLITCAHADPSEVTVTRNLHGADSVLVCGEERVDLAQATSQLHDRGFGCVLTEGGPALLSSALTDGAVDEICLTIAPRVVGGDGKGLLAPSPSASGLAAPGFDLAAAPTHLLVDDDGTLLGRWRITRG